MPGYRAAPSIHRSSSNLIGATLNHCFENNLLPTSADTAGLVGRSFILLQSHYLSLQDQRLSRRAAALHCAPHDLSANPINITQISKKARLYREQYTLSVESRNASPACCHSLSGCHKFPPMVPPEAKRMTASQRNTVNAALHSAFSEGKSFGSLDALEVYLKELVAPNLVQNHISEIFDCYLQLISSREELPLSPPLTIDRQQSNSVQPGSLDAEDRSENSDTAGPIFALEVSRSSSYTDLADLNCYSGPSLSHQLLPSSI